MKNFKIEKFSLLVFLTLLISIPIAKSLGITGIIPPDLRMMRGDSAEFYFQIQALGSSSKLSCTLYTEEFEPLIITFEESPVTVDADTIKNIYGTVTIPMNAPIKTYSGIFFAKCSPYVERQDVSGSVITQTMGAKYNLDVVSTEAERNIRTLVKTTPPEEVPVISTSTIMTILIIVIAILVVGFYYWSQRQKRRK